MPVAEIYIIKPGDTLSKIAQNKHVTVAQLIDANPQISNPNRIVIGEAIKIPTTDAAPGTQPAPAAAPGHAVVYDGIHPAPGTTTSAKASYNHPPLTNDAAHRNANAYAQVINQFAVNHNGRYRRDGNGTYCNIFVWDVTRAMNCEIPHWVDRTGDTAVPRAGGAREININAGLDWMEDFGIPHHGWQEVSAQTAQNHANQGRPAVAMWKNRMPGGHGHTAMIRPGSINNRGPATAQAGSINFNQGHMSDGFGDHVPRYFIHN